MTEYKIENNKRFSKYINPSEEPLFYLGYEYENDLGIEINNKDKYKELFVNYVEKRMVPEKAIFEYSRASDYSLLNNRIHPNDFAIWFYNKREKKLTDFKYTWDGGGMEWQSPIGSLQTLKDLSEPLKEIFLNPYISGSRESSRRNSGGIHIHVDKNKYTKPVATKIEYFMKDYSYNISKFINRTSEQLRYGSLYTQKDRMTDKYNCLNNIHTFSFENRVWGAGKDQLEPALEFSHSLFSYAIDAEERSNDLIWDNYLSYTNRRYRLYESLLERFSKCL